MNDSRCRIGGAVAVGVIGAALLGARIWFGSLPWSTPVSDVAPIGLAALLFVVAGWLPRSDLDGPAVLFVPAATVGGMAAFAAFAAFVTGELLATSVGVPETVLLVNFLSAGGALGLVAGLLAATTWTLRVRETELRDTRDAYRELFDGIGDAVLVHDTRGVVLAANDAAFDRLGYDAAALTGRRITEVEGDATGDWSVVDDRVVYETAHVTADGETIPVEVSARHVRYRGSPAVLSVARDVSRRRASEQQLARTRDRLRALNRVLRHDIRNDMQIVLGMARLLDDRLDDADDTTRDHLRTIVDTGEHVVELTRSSRDLARTVAGETDPSLHPVSLTETLTSELDRRRSAFGHATFAVDGEIPDVDVRANDLLSSVFRNLLNNAVQHSDRAEPAVTVSAVRDDGRVAVRIADDGPGIPTERRQAVFEKAGTGDDGGERRSTGSRLSADDDVGRDPTGSRLSAGDDETGLGLFLVESLVDQYGGSVSIEDNDPRGTVVTVELIVESTAEARDPDVESENGVSRDVESRD